MKLITLERRNKRRVRSGNKIFGTSARPRISVFRSNKFTYVQLIDDENGRTIASASTRGSQKKGEKKLTQAEALGKAIAEQALKLGVKRAVFDKRSYHYHGRIKAIAEKAREAGLTI
ncbi:MAG: 50S ribosomal protein L18 [Patescibacteria group bacterium]